MIEYIINVMSPVNCHKKKTRITYNYTLIMIMPCSNNCLLQIMIDCLTIKPYLIQYKYSLSAYGL